MKASVLEKYLLEHIPLSSAMGVKVDLASSEKVVLSAPISKNINHKSTVFGGSLHAVATLACWSLLHLNLTDFFDEAFHVVIASSEVRYLAPVVTDFKVESHRPDDEQWERFLTVLRKRGKARLQLTASIFEKGRLCVDYSGDFVALKVHSI